MPVFPVSSGTLELCGAKGEGAVLAMGPLLLGPVLVPGGPLPEGSVCLVPVFLSGLPGRL